MVNIKAFKKVNKTEELGKKICKLVKYYEQEKGRVMELVALVDVLFSIREIFRSYDERFKKLEENLKNKERMMGIYTEEKIKLEEEMIK